MLIVAIQDRTDELYAIYDTVIDRFLGVNLNFDDAVKIIVESKQCDYDNAKERIEHPQSFMDIVKQLEV